MIAIRERISPLSWSPRAESSVDARPEPLLNRRRLMIHDLCGALVLLLALVAYVVLA